MAEISVSLRNIPGTEAALGWAGGHTLVIDRPEGRAGGQGLGFNGGQMIALAIGGCLCNDLRYVAHADGIELTDIDVRVTVTLTGEPLLVTRADVFVQIAASDPAADLDALLARAEADSTVGNSVRSGFPVRVLRQTAPHA